MSSCAHSIKLIFYVFWLLVTFSQQLALELERCIGMPIYIGQYDDVAVASYRQNSTDIYQQYLLIKAAMLLFSAECLETQVATSSPTD